MKYAAQKRAVITNLYHLLSLILSTYAHQWIHRLDYIPVRGLHRYYIALDAVGITTPQHLSNIPSSVLRVPVGRKRILLGSPFLYPL